MQTKTLIGLTAGLLMAAAGAQAVTLYDNGPVVGADGYSVISAATTTYGLGVSTAGALKVADNFTVAAGAPWTVQSINFFSYQTNATSFTLTTATWSIVSGDVNTGTVVASGSTALTNGGLVGYRVTSPGADTARAIYTANANMADFSLASGSYWLTWSLAGSSSFSGPWAPPTSDGATGNAMQSVSGGAFATAVDATTGVTFELPFQILGVSAVPEPSEYALLLAGLGVVGFMARRSRRVR